MTRRSVLGVLLASAATALTVIPAAPASAHGGADLGDVATNTRGAQVETQGEGRAMEFVANLQYNDSGQAQNGSDIEFMRIGGKEYALAGTLRGGLQIIDITDPREPRRVAVYDCRVTQGDIQVWKNRGRVLATYTADGTFGTQGAASQCGRDLDLQPSASGTVIVDLTTPSKPRTVSYLHVPRGSHNMTIHPSGDYLYNSNSDLITSTAPTITIYDVSQPAAPKKVKDFPLPFVPTSLGSESHDITFNASGTRAYSAALSQTLVLDTTDPRDPRIVSQIVDPAVNVAHQSDPVTLTREDGSKRDVLVVTDERAGAAASAECPGGGLHLYDITGAKEKSPEKIGTWFIPAATVQAGATCTSHVLRIYPDQELATIAWYAQGVRVLDLSALADYDGDALDVGIGDGVGITEVGHYVLPDSDTWSFKTNKIAKDGSFFGYGNDLVRGFDVYRFTGETVGDVAPLLPVDLAAAADSSIGGTAVAGGLALMAPALLLGAVARRRSRGRSHG
ncbi:MAG: LVIVD repeat-containing protein [Actinomycetes bacterium]